MLEALVRLAQAHARLMFRNECTVMDAVFAIILMEGSHNSSQLLQNDFSVLRAEFGDDPDGEYMALEEAVLLGIGFAGGEFSGDGAGGRDFGGRPADFPQGDVSSAAKRPRVAEDGIGHAHGHAHYDAGAPPPRMPGAAPSQFDGFF